MVGFAFFRQDPIGMSVRVPGQTSRGLRRVASSYDDARFQLARLELIGVPGFRLGDMLRLGSGGVERAPVLDRPPVGGIDDVARVHACERRIAEVGAVPEGSQAGNLRVGKPRTRSDSASFLEYANSSCSRGTPRSGFS